VLTAGSAAAQARGELGEKGQFIFSADRLVPILGYTNNSAAASASGGAISLFYGNNSWGGTGAGAGGVAAWGNPTFYTVPRLGFDYTVIQNLTVGGNFVVAFPTGGNVSSCTGNTCVQNDTPGGNVWGLAPRVGYVIAIPDMMAIWLRGGLSYYHSNASVAGAVPLGCPSANTTDTSGVFGLDLEPQFVIAPITHFAFEVGPTLDWGFAGNTTNETPTLGAPCGTTTKTSYGYTSLYLGVTGGLFGWF
jgi:hypothetical protein